MKELKFTCPKCGKHELGSVEEIVMTYPITKINEDGDFDYDTQNPGIGDGEVLAYQCLNCGYELKDEHGYAIQNCISAAEWVKKHCKENTENN